MGCELASVTLQLEACLDMRVEYGLEPTGTPEHLVSRVRVESPSPSAAVLAMSDEAHRRCPLAQLVGRSLPIHRRVEHNGVVVLDTLPAELAVTAPDA